MTPETLHQRILLHELRTILLDDTREGDQIPAQWKEVIQENPHEREPYLVLADALDEAGSDLGELCRIQCELIGELPAERLNASGESHPFVADILIERAGETERSPLIDLLTRRWEIVEPLYGPRECQISEEAMRARGETARGRGPITDRVLAENGFDINRPLETSYEGRNGSYAHYFSQSPPLGRTTRMLTDVLRYCWINREKRVIIQHNHTREEMQGRFLRLFAEIYGQPHDGPNSSDYIIIFKNIVDFEFPQEPYRGPRAITFTDHACHVEISDYETADFTRLPIF